MQLAPLQGEDTWGFWLSRPGGRFRREEEGAPTPGPEGALGEGRYSVAFTSVILKLRFGASVAKFPYILSVAS